MRGVSGGTGQTSAGAGAGFFLSAAVTVVRSTPAVRTTIKARVRDVRRVIRSSTSEGVAADAQRAGAGRAEAQQLRGGRAMRVVTARAAERSRRFGRIGVSIDGMSDCRMTGAQGCVEADTRRA